MLLASSMSHVYIFICSVRLEAAMLMHLICLKEKPECQCLTHAVGCYIRLSSNYGYQLNVYFQILVALFIYTAAHKEIFERGDSVIRKY